VKKLVVADAARRDLESIARYTEERWGATQRRRYMDTFNEAFARLREGSVLGGRRDDVRPGLLSLAVGRHVMLFKEIEETIEILRVLHDRMDVHRHLPDQL